MSDLQKILVVLSTMQNDIKDLKMGQEELKSGQEAIKLDQEAIKVELRTMKDRTAHSLDSLSTQFLGVVQDFDTLVSKLYASFDRWSEQAHSLVTDKVLAIQGPHIKAVENRMHEIKVCTW